MKDSLVVANICDIHFGAMDAKTLYKELKSEFIDKIERMPILDLIVIGGDTYHSKVSYNSSHVKTSLKFVTEVCEVAKKKDCAVRVLKGTLSHDNDQLDNLKMFSEICNFKIINVLSDEIYRGHHILYIPEEYVDDVKEYHEQELLNQEYDLIFGHGMIKEASFVAHKQESGITMRKAVILNTDQLLDICKGVILFGHIHIAGIYKKRFYYTGSFSRWCFGEEDDKGFNIVYYNRKCPHKTKVEFMVNNKARIFDTVTLDINNPDIQTVCTTILGCINMTKFDKKRIIVNIGDEVESPAMMASVISETYNNYNNVKIVINSLAKEIARRDNDEKVERLLSEYGFIFDKSLSKEQEIYMYINKKYNRDIPIERIKMYLYEKIFE